MTKLWVRADGSATLGLGHVMRTIALAQAARRRGLAVRFVITADSTASSLPVRFGFEVVELAGPDDRSWLAGVRPTDLVCVDGYHFDEDDLRELVATAPRVAAMTDFTTGRFPVPVIVNQNPADELDYDHPAGAEVLVGPRYALIREGFFPHRRSPGRSASRALITMGGSDVSELGLRLAERTRELEPSLQVVLLRGPAGPPGDAPGVEVVADPPDVPATFASADLAISAAGSTTWELLYLGIPSALVQVADNQAAIGPGVARLGAAIFLGTSTDALAALPAALDRLTDPIERDALTAAGLGLVDGEGADRVLDALLSSS